MGIENILDKRVDYSEDLDEYNSKFEFEKFDIVNIEEKRDLNNKEEKILKTMNTIKKNTFEFSFSFIRFPEAWFSFRVIIFLELI